MSFFDNNSSYYDVYQATCTSQLQKYTASGNILFTEDQLSHWSQRIGQDQHIGCRLFSSYCKSHNVNIDSQCITHDEDFFVLQGTYHIEPDGEDHIYCGLKRNRKKQFKRNQKEYSRLSDHIGRLPLVFVSPNDQALIAGGSEDRRRFIDSIISQYDHEYLQFLIRYNTALQQRNALLKQNELPSAELFEIWEQQMHDLGSEIFLSTQGFHGSIHSSFSRVLPFSFERARDCIVGLSVTVNRYLIGQLIEGEASTRPLSRIHHERDSP